MKKENSSEKADEKSDSGNNVVKTEKRPAYGKLLAEELSSKGDLKNLTDYENFTLNRGFLYNTEKDLLAGYNRSCKCNRNVLLTEDEFIIEAGEYYESETLKAVYAALCNMVGQKKMLAGEVYRYAYFKWCLRNAAAIIAYKEDRDIWIVNNCDTEKTEAEAKVSVNDEWGFEASRIKIIGTPYYDATDYQFIRFNCGHMSWLWKNGNLYQICE